MSKRLENKNIVVTAAGQGIRPRRSEERSRPRRPGHRIVWSTV